MSIGSGKARWIEMGRSRRYERTPDNSDGGTNMRTQLMVTDSRLDVGDLRMTTRGDWLNGGSRTIRD